MPVHALWSAPRSRSTAFFLSMSQRGDLLALHEPLEHLHFVGPLQIDGQTFESPPSLLHWLADADRTVFLKETVNPPVQAQVVRDRRFLVEAHHAFLIRRPEEIAASFRALEGDVRIMDTGVELLHDLFLAVRDAGGHAPVVVDADDLVSRPEATMRAYCAAVGLPFLVDSLQWEPGDRPEWSHSARWHEAAARSSGFVAPSSPAPRAAHPDVALFAERHQPFYDALRRHRLVPEPG